MDRRRVVAQLRAKADSTPYPAEAVACRAKADEIEARYPEARRPRAPTRAVFRDDDPRNRHRVEDDPVRTAHSDPHADRPPRGSSFDEQLRWIRERVEAHEREVAEAMARQAEAQRTAQRMRDVFGFVTVSGSGTSTTSGFDFAGVDVTVEWQ